MVNFLCRSFPGMHPFRLSLPWVSIIQLQHNGTEYIWICSPADNGAASKRWEQLELEGYRRRKDQAVVPPVRNKRGRWWHLHSLYHREDVGRRGASDGRISPGDANVWIITTPPDNQAERSDFCKPALSQQRQRRRHPGSPRLKPVCQWGTNEEFPGGQRDTKQGFIIQPSFWWVDGAAHTCRMFS